MNFAMFISASDYSLGEGALYAVVGFMIVLAVLALLVGIFYLSGFLFRTKFLSRDNLFKRDKKPENASVQTESADAGESDEQLFAVISAVISAIYDEEAQSDSVKPEFVIRRIKRK
ncbi:MAG: OadG family protein [Clostridiales bacterium]|nr:OadG family protein [Clostridiales bacterium]